MNFAMNHAFRLSVVSLLPCDL